MKLSQQMTISQQDRDILNYCAEKAAQAYTAAVKIAFKVEEK